MESELNDKPDWIVKVVVDKGSGSYYRYTVSGENLNYAPDHPNREFSWNVPNIDNPRYDLSNAIFVQRLDG